MTWRDSAKPIIQKIIFENKDKSEKEIRAALRAAYPWDKGVITLTKFGVMKLISNSKSHLKRQGNLENKIYLYLMSYEKLRKSSCSYFLHTVSALFFTDKLQS